MGILSWIILGLIAGAIGKFLMPGDDPGGFIVTTIIGMVGAIIGGFIGTVLGLGDVTGFDMRSLILAIGGSIVLLLIWRALKARRG